MNMLVHAPQPAPLAKLHEEFLAMLPQILAVARFGFRDVQCLDKKDDAVAEVVALSWKWYVRLAQLQRKDKAHPTALAGFAVKQVRSGRRVVGQMKAKDALNPHTQHRAGFTVEPLPHAAAHHFAEAYSRPAAQRTLDALEEQLSHNTQTPVLDQVQFRLDWPAWLKSLNDRDRRMIADMGHGERTLDLARKHRISPARISQLRREYQSRWHTFLGEPTR
jgi:hypothetical protein